MKKKKQDPRTKGSKAAILNNPKYREKAHPWHIPYNSRCLISGCDTKVYHDGKTYFSLCLLHLEELNLGPFYRAHEPHQETNYD